MFNANTFRYYSLNRITLIVIYLVILAGGIVRCTGSGMGCPDWPKCFGYWVPPTQESQLPSNYKEIFKINQWHSVEFNVFKTWTEYINRLVGAISGLLILITFIYSLFLSELKYKLYSFFTLALILFQGLLGARVVSTNLADYMITIHMFFALVIVGFLLFILHKIKKNINNIPVTNGLLIMCLGVMLLIVFQILMGTQVRRMVDFISYDLNYTLRETWIDKLGVIFYVHRSFSLVILATMVVLYFRLSKNKLLQNYQALNILACLTIIFSGVILNYLNFPGWAQPIHLFISSIIFGIQFYLFLNLYSSKTLRVENV